MEPTKTPVRALRPEDFEVPRPIYAVWELTLKCDQPCEHCGSRAGPTRTKELSTAEALDVCAALAQLGCREIVLIGGEAYLRPDLHEIVAALAAAGIRVTMQTGGRAMTEERAHALRRAGLSAMGVSIDGPAAIHDRLRGNLGSHHAAIRALDAAKAAGLATSVNTQINRLNHDRLPETCAELRAHGAVSWQVQLTVPMGRAADRPEWILEPFRIVDVIDTLARLQLEAAESNTGRIPFNIVLGNNVGYFGPHEQILRSRPGGPDGHWQGCRAGLQVIGIESDGTIKGCPSLPTGPYAGGNVRDLPLSTIWQDAPELRFARDRTTDELWGFCKTCYYGDVCLGGCSWTAHVTLGRRGNNPFCYHRAVELRRQGIRETLVRAEAPPGAPYDMGRFEIVEEPVEASIKG
jgi:radical SAM protein with 4Fe4S-binding SPASM domain